MIGLVGTLMHRYTSVLKALKEYPGSKAQAHLFNYHYDKRAFDKIKKGIDYETITKNSKGRLMIREFLFQEKVDQNYIAPLGCIKPPI